MQYKDIDNKAEALLELNNVFDLFSLIRKDNVLIIISDNGEKGEEGEFTIRVLDSTQEEEVSTANIIAQGVMSMLEEDPDIVYMQGIKAAENEYVAMAADVLGVDLAATGLGYDALKASGGGLIDAGGNALGAVGALFFPGSTSAAGDDE